MTIWQSKSWQEMLIRRNQAQEVFDVDGVKLEKRSIGLGLYGLFGLGITRDQKINGEEIIKLGKKQKVVFIQLEDYKINGEKSYDDKDFKPGYYKKFITPYTIYLDLNMSLDDVLTQMKPKGRYNIRLSEKKGVGAYEVEKSSENIEIFYNLMQETTSRDGFFGNTLDYYKTFLNVIKNSKLIFAKYDDKIISAGIFILDEYLSIYYYGASTSDSKYRNLMAPYLVQWKAIEIAKSCNSRYFDFLGVADPNDPDDPLLGVTQFKERFGGHKVNISSSYIYINKKVVYNMIRLYKKLKP